MNGTAWTIVGAQGLNSAGDQIVLISLSWFLVRTDGSGFLGLTLAVWAITRGILLLWGGVVADRHDRRRMSVVSGLCLSALVLSVAGWDPSHAAGQWVWVAVALGLGTLDGIRIPIAGSLIPFVVARDQLVQANRWMQLRQWALAAIGPTLGASLMALGGIRLALAIAGLVYGLSALAMLTIPPIPAVHDAHQSGWMDLRAGLHFVLTHPRLKVFLLTFATANFFVLGILSVGIVAFARTVLHTDPLGLGILTGCFAAGLALGTLLVPYLPATIRHVPYYVFVLFMVSDGLLALVGWTHSLPAAAIIYGTSGLLAGPPATLYRTWLQVIPPAALLGRVNSIARSLSFGLEPASAALTGIASQALTANVVIIVAGSAAGVLDLFGAIRSRAWGRDLAESATTR